jgi:hypothetical protein
VLEFFPVVGFLAIATSMVTLGMLLTLRDLRTRTAVTLAAGVAAAGYCQFFASSTAVAVAGLLAQTLLAVFLVVRWRLTA